MRQGPALTLVLLAAAAVGCRELSLAPEVEVAGEPGTPVYAAAGVFEPIAYPATGSARYVLDDAGGAALVLGSDFTMPALPGVSIFLSNSPDLERAVKVGELGGPAGPRRWTFRVPRGAVWSWAVLWSEERDVGVARARLRPGS